MITRREMNTAFVLTAFFSGAPAALVQAQALPAERSSPSHMPNMPSIAVKTLRRVISSTSPRGTSIAFCAI